VLTAAAASRRQNVGRLAASDIQRTSAHDWESPYAGQLLEAATGVEPVMEVLQSSVRRDARCLVV
jgi:hypothetical protein